MSRLFKLVVLKKRALSSAEPKPQALSGVESPLRTPKSHNYISHFKEHFDISFVDVEPSVTTSFLAKPYDSTPYWIGNFDQKMAEPRARAARHKGQLNFGPESRQNLQDILAHPDHSPFERVSITPTPLANFSQLLHFSMHSAMFLIRSVKPCAFSMRS